MPSKKPSAANLSLRPHPRLLYNDRLFERLTPARLRQPRLRAAAEECAALAEEYRQGVEIDTDFTRHNAHLIRARVYQGRIFTLLVQWRRTGDAGYRTAAMRHIAAMEGWTYWSWILWRQRDRRPDGLFDLSYGENSATLAMAWDLMHDTLSDKEKDLFLRIVRRWPVASFLANAKIQKNWWFGKPDSNWNTVCAGGLGMLALTMMEELPEAPALLEQTEASFEPYMRQINRLGGGWPEGIGYWGYGMRYAFMYLLSHESATGKHHPLMLLPGTARTLDFPLDFSPYNIGCSFGDVNHYQAMPFHYLLAERFKRPEIVAMLDQRVAQATANRTVKKRGVQAWPTTAEILLCYPDAKLSRPKPQTNRLRHYPGLDWFSLSDRWPDPKLYLSIRGGTTEVPHGHIDLTSFNLVTGDEALIVNLGAGEYLDTTFSPRRWDLFEMTPPSKNVMLLNGVGIQRPATVRGRALTVGKYPAVRLDATDCLGAIRGNEKALRFYGRLFVLLGRHAVLVLDRMILKHFGRFDMRFHTYGKITLDGHTAVIRGKRQSLGVTMAADIPCFADQAVDALTSPGPSSALLRWRSNDLHPRVLMGALFAPNAVKGSLAMTALDGGWKIDTRVGRHRFELKLTDRLMPVTR